MISSVILMLLAGQLSFAQYNGFDASIYEIRDNFCPDFRYKYDDYLQYSPALVMMGLKGLGVESRSSWSSMLASDVFSTAIMAAAVNGLKYTVQRPRPDQSHNNSFPSGHTATAFMTATMLHKEYSWRSPWFSIGGYTIAAVTGVSRILNNKHWMTDIAAGAAIGIGSVHLGYYLSDLLFKDRRISESYKQPVFDYDASVKHYTAEIQFGRRYVLGYQNMKDERRMPLSGGLVALSADVPVTPQTGVKARVSANSLAWSGEGSSNMYGVLAGGYWNAVFGRRFEFQTNVMAGYSWFPSMVTEGKRESGAALSTGVSLGVMLDNNFRLKAFADFESVSMSSSRPWMNSVIIGWSSAWVW